MPKSKKKGNSSGARPARARPYTHRGGNSSSSKAANPPPPELKSFKTFEYKFDHDTEPRGGRKWYEMHDLNAPGVDALTFKANFEITDQTLATLSQYPALCTRLRTFIAGDEETGNGTWVTERAFIDFVANCPDLRLVCLDSHLKLGKISGHNKASGNIDAKALVALAETCERDSSFAVSLRDLTLIDQRGDDEKAIKRLQKARPLLIIRTGQSEGKYDYDGCAMDMAYKNGKIQFGPQVWEQYSWW